MEINVVFMGSPDFAVLTLKALADHYKVVGVVTQPDRPAGRGQVLAMPPVKTTAQELGIPIIQPNRLKEPGAFETLQEWSPDLIVVAAFGQLLRKNVLDLPKYGCINVHASLLPRWRGASPIQAAILHGDDKTGVTIMKMDPGLDTGPWLAMREERIHDEDTAETLSERLAIIGSELLIETLPGYLAGEIELKLQDESRSTYAGLIKKEDGLLDFTQPVDILERKVRAYHPWPGAYFNINGQVIKVFRARQMKGETTAGQTGVIDKLPAVAADGGWLILQEVQPAGKKPMDGKVFLNGFRNWGSLQL